ncbi:FUSC family protein [Ktedonobacter racemifer]|uniref:Integral membrane bound transporter domain-containing protein n=1 Tax=Ktedonobacter racemifer DSM 44963 TaxID=485913 RepID=D6TIM9_KTERA|nr:FUSC family protein [Ktedonobacter racemifer]EFH89286.1 protein of unknown function DUF893 YccS/YhfK [Ktedonobacter racemifer DSM 44963]
MSKSSTEGSESKWKEKRPSSRNVEREPGSWLASLGTSWRAVWQFDRSQFTSFQAIRCTLGFMLPLALGVATGQVTASLVIAVGGLLLGLVGLRDPSRTRARGMLLDSLFMALSALVGGITGSVGWLLVLVTGMWGVVAGVFASVSPMGLIVGLHACSALVVFAHFALTPVQALQIAALVGIGALFQTLLTIIPSPWTNTAPERSALVAIYQKLAAYAANVFSGQDVLQLADVLIQGQTTLFQSDTRTEQGKLFARLLEKAERVRLTLTILASSARQLTREQQREGGASDHLCRIMQASAGELRTIAQALHPSRHFIETSGSEPEEAIQQSLTELSMLAQTSGGKPEIERILPYCTALLSELYLARRLAVSWRDARQGWSLRTHFLYPRPPRLHLADPWSNLRANLTLQSSAFRHALRLGIALSLATALYLVFHLSADRGYWIPLTVMLVLRSDFITTFTRGIARLLGTMLGAVLTTLLVVFLQPSQPMLVAIITIAAYLMYSTLPANYAIFSAAVAMAVVFLDSFTTSQTVMTAAYRAIDTAIGGALALLIYALWPTWEQSQVPATISRRIETLGHYLDAILHLYADPGELQTVTLDQRHLEERLARSNARGSVRRMLQEPKAHRVPAELAEGLLEAADPLTRRGLTLEAYLRDHAQRSALPAMATFGQQVDEAMSRLAAALREGRQPPPLPDLPEALRALQAAARADKQAQDEARAQWNFLIAEAKRIVRNIEAIRQLLLQDSAPVDHLRI